VKKTILDKSLNFITIKEKDETLLMNFTHKHAEHSKINNYKSVYVGNDAKYIKLCWHEEYDLFFTVDDFIKWIIGNKMKFDKVIMNPPYDGNLHLKILEQVTKSCPDAEIVCIQPAKWIQDPFINDSKDKKFAYMIDKISKYEIIPNKEMNKYFKLSIGDGVITFFEKNNTCNYKNDFTEIAKKITSISNYATVLKNHSIKTDFFIPLAKFRWTCGDEKCGMPYSLILNSSGKYAKSGWTSHLHDTYELFYFNTQSEVDNLKLLFKNTILPKIIGKIFYGKRMPMRHIPLPGDYTSPWTNERLYKYFNLTDDEIKYIEDMCK
jgi:hypothetical protein